MTSIFRNFPSFCLVLTLASCVPKAIVVEEAAAKKIETPAVAEQAVPEGGQALVPELNLPAGPDNEIRVPGGMMSLPTDSEFRASSQQLPGSGSSGVFVRPPTDPPSRVKPTE